jgi:hypothetical protein
VTNGSSFDKNLTSSDAETLKDKEKERTAAKALPTTDTARNIKQGAAEVKTGRTSTLHTRTPTATNSSTVKKDTKTTTPTTTTMSNPKYKKAANTARVGSAR